MAKFGRFIARRRLCWSLLVACVLLGGTVAFVSRKPPPFLVLSRPYKFTASLRDRLERWIPANWGWVWKFEEAVIGKRKPVNLSAEVLSIDHSAAFSAVGLPEPDLLCTNLQVWILNGEQLGAFRQRVKNSGAVTVVHNARLCSADGIESCMGVGHSVPIGAGASTNFVGLQFGNRTRLHHDRADLSLWVIFTELVTNQVPRSAASEPPNTYLVQTNFDAGFRVQLPKGKGLFVVQQGSHWGQQAMGVLLDPPQPAK